MRCSIPRAPYGFESLGFRRWTRSPLPVPNGSHSGHCNNQLCPNENDVVAERSDGWHAGLHVPQRRQPKISVIGIDNGIRSDSLDHSGIVWNCWTGALAHLGVARANALEAKTSPGAGRYRPRSGARSLPRFSSAVERRRSRHSHPPRPKSRIRKASLEPVWHSRIFVGRGLATT
jgi:hypothetical protein